MQDKYQLQKGNDYAPSERAKAAVRTATGTSGGFVAKGTDHDIDDRAPKELAPKAGKVAAQTSKPDDTIKSSTSL